MCETYATARFVSLAGETYSFSARRDQAERIRPETIGFAAN